MNAVGPDEPSPTDFDGLQPTITNEFIDFGSADAESVPSSGHCHGNGFHCAVSMSDPHDAGPSTAAYWYQSNAIRHGPIRI
jgi:hypothetical protein